MSDSKFSANQIDVVGLSNDPTMQANLGNGGDRVVDNFADGVDYTAGTTTVLTLSTAPSTENNINVSFDGIVQHHTEYTLSGTTLTFSSAIPIGTVDVEVVIGVTLALNVPATDSVATATIQDGAVTAVKLADDYVNVTGDTMTGDLVLTNAASAPFLVLKRSAAQDTADTSLSIGMEDNAGTRGTYLTWDAPSDNVYLGFNTDAAGWKQMTLDNTGNVFSTATEPTLDKHFTRKDYVDTVAATRNVIINGNFDVNQRDFTSLAITNGASFEYAADRLIYYNDRSTGAATLSRNTDVPTYAQSGVFSTASINVAITTALVTPSGNNEAVFSYRVEGYDYRMIAGGDATLSFWVKTNKTGIHSVSLRNSGRDRSYVFEFTVSVASTWEKITVTIPLTETGGTWDYADGEGIQVTITMMGVTSPTSTLDQWQTGNLAQSTNQVNLFSDVGNFFRIAQLKFEKGDVATPLNQLHFADELAQCQRYAQVITHTAWAVIGVGRADGTADVITSNIALPVEMRELPLMVVSTGFTQVNHYDGTSITTVGDLTLGWTSSTTHVAYYVSDGLSGLTANAVYQVAAMGSPLTVLLYADL